MSEVRPPRELLTDRLGWLGIRSAQLLLVVTLSTVAVYALVQLRLVVIPVLIALILAAAVSPLVNLLRRKGVPGIVATWLTLLAGFVVFGGLITLVVFAVRRQWNDLTTAATVGLDSLQNYLSAPPLSIDQEQLRGVRQAGLDFLGSSSFGAGALAGVSLATEVITGALLVLVITFFFLKDGSRIWSFLLTPFTGERLARGRRIGHTTLRVLGSYVRGTAIVALVDAVAIGVGLLLLQVPLALPLAVVVFLGAFIPLVGATVAGLLAALVALVANGPVTALIVVVIVVAVNQLEGDLLQPVVMGQSLNLHPLVILVALTAGTILGGIVGAVLSVPIAAVAWAIAKTWQTPGTGGEPEASPAT